MQSKQIIVGVSALIFDKFPNPTKYLMIKRENPPFKNYWSIPGGKLEFGECVDEAIIREVQEELGFKIKLLDPPHKTANNNIVGNKHYLIISRAGIIEKEGFSCENLYYEYFDIKKRVKDEDCVPNLNKIINEFFRVYL